jgi:hypothetical protein
MSRFQKMLLVATTAGLLFSGGCLVDNFWANKFSEIVNRGIFGIINNALAAGNLETI